MFAHCLKSFDKLAGASVNVVSASRPDVSPVATTA
jgi:hypothetical protein